MAVCLFLFYLVQWYSVRRILKARLWIWHWYLLVWYFCIWEVGKQKRRGVTHRAYPVILYYSIMILYSTSNVSFGSNFCIHSRSFNSPEYPTESQRPYHGSMQTNGQSGCVLVGDHKATNGELNSKLIWGFFFLSSKVIFFSCLLIINPISQK